MDDQQSVRTPFLHCPILSGIDSNEASALIRSLVLDQFQAKITNFYPI